MFVCTQNAMCASVTCLLLTAMTMCWSVGYGLRQGVFYGELFGQLGLVLGTSQDPVATYFIEPAFVNSTVGLLPQLDQYHPYMINA